MNSIQMYSSSTQLKLGLHRALAVAHALVSPMVPHETVAWWSLLEDDEQTQGRAHSLPLDALARIYERLSVQSVLDAGRTSVGLAPLDHRAVQVAFKAAVLSGRAHRAHMGRDVYGLSNKGLWDLVCGDFGRAVSARFGPSLGEGPVSIAESSPSDEALTLLRTLTAFDTTPTGSDHHACVAWFASHLGSQGFTVSTITHECGRPLVVAHREARGLSGHVVLYGHYDVTPFGNEEKWTHPPRELTLANGRLFARGVADNKGPLASRLAALEALESTPALTWLIQGEEETGSAVAHAELPRLMRDLRPTLWLDETGYHDAEAGTLRLLARTVGTDNQNGSPDPVLATLLCALRGLASRWGVAARHECRGLNKTVVEGGCPFNRSLPEGARYLAMGVNDTGARIHGRNESLPGWTFPLHAAELDVIFRWASHTARGAA